MSERPPRNEPGLIPEPDNLREPTPTPEQIESEQVAERKLEQLLSPDFKDFAVRFVNRNEYQGILDSGDWKKPGSENEVYVPAWNNRRYEETPSFREYLHENSEKVRGKRSWSQEAQYATLIDRGSYAIGKAKLLLDELKSALQKERETQQSSTAERSVEVMHYEALEGFVKDTVRNESYWILNQVVRQAAEYETIHKKLQELAQNLEAIVGKEVAQKLISEIDTAAEMMVKNNDYYQWGKSFKEHNIPEEKIRNALQVVFEISDIKEDIAWAGGEETLKFINRFLEDPTMIHNRKSRRELFNALSYADKLDRGRWQHYHLLLVFDLKAVNKGQGISHWGNLNPNDIDSQEHFLGAVTLMPNKELWQKAAERSSRAGKLAHPIFDCNGALRYPKPVSSSTSQQPE